MLKVYSLFHLNLMYSSIEVESREQVINSCYWPLLNLAEKGYPIAIEASGITLEIINALDRQWITKLKRMLKNQMVEFVGSGYSQIIGPLVPAKVNEYNQKIGQDLYYELLGIQPHIALVNEMAFSAGVVGHYANNGYDTIIMEWNNPRMDHPEWKNEWRYHAHKAKGYKNQVLSLLCADCIAFQKFQRYVHGENDLIEYIDYLKSHNDKTDRFFPLYSNDVEIFNHRPGRYHTEESLNKYSEWDKIIQLYHYLNQQDWCVFIFPSEVLNGLDHPHGGHEVKLESPSQPIPVKKQEKYNIYRWALTGRNDLGVNTHCYRVASTFMANKNLEDWKELCYLWSSDFRTHITQKRWDEYVIRLNEFKDKWTSVIVPKSEEFSDSNCQFIKTEDQNQITVENDSIIIILNKNKGLTIKRFVLKKLSHKSLLGMVDHGYYDNISLGADYYSGHAVIAIPGEHKLTDLSKVKPEISQTNDTISLKSIQKLGEFTFQNNIIIDKKCVIVDKHIESSSSAKSVIRPFNFTFNPLAWDRRTLYVQTHNGGSKLERFNLSRNSIDHSDIYSSLISARHCFGNTEGLFIVGDMDKSLTFECDMTWSALIPSIIYKEMSGTFFFRLQYSAREMDETLKMDNRPNTTQANIKINFDF